MGIAYEKFLDLLEEVEIHVIDMLYPDFDEEKVRTGVSRVLKMLNPLRTTLIGGRQHPIKHSDSIRQTKPSSYSHFN